MIEKNLDEPRIELILDGEDKVLQKKVISPSARDIEVAGKMGFGGTVEFNAKEAKNKLIEETKAIRKDIRERLFSGKLTYLEAASECNDEGIDVPELWQAREIQRILSDGRKEKLTNPSLGLRFSTRLEWEVIIEILDRGWRMFYGLSILFVTTPFWLCRFS